MRHRAASSQCADGDERIAIVTFRTLDYCLHSIRVMQRLRAEEVVEKLDQIPCHWSLEVSDSSLFVSTGGNPRRRPNTAFVLFLRRNMSRRRPGRDELAAGDHLAGRCLAGKRLWLSFHVRTVRKDHCQQRRGQQQSPEPEHQA